MFGTKLRRTDHSSLQQLQQQELFECSINKKDELRVDAQARIERIETENIRQYNIRRKKAREYAIDEFLAIQRTQFIQGSKLLSSILSFMGPYRVTKKNWL